MDSRWKIPKMATILSARFKEKRGDLFPFDALDM
jgi:hypothetical protein